MLRVTVSNSTTSAKLKLEGKIVGPWVDELRTCWLSLVPSLGSHELCLDLRGVSFVDEKGKELLREIYEQSHARFLADTPLTQYFADSAVQRSVSRDGKGA